MLQRKVRIQDEPDAILPACPDLKRRDLSVLFDLLDNGETDQLMGFLQASKRQGGDRLTMVVDLWRACRVTVAEALPNPSREAYVAHAVKALLRHTYETVLLYYCELPNRTAEQQSARAALWDLRYSLLRVSLGLTETERDDVEDLLRTHRGTVLAYAYHCKEAILALFRASQTQEGARSRRNMVVQWFGDVLELEEMIRLVQGNEFERTIGYLKTGARKRCRADRAHPIQLHHISKAAARPAHA
jgi:hypothetical protein